MWKRLFGLIGLLLGLAGFVATAGLAVAVWPGSRWVADEGESLVDQAEPQVAFFKQKLDKADSHVQKVSRQIAELKTAARRVEQQGENSNPEDIKKVQTAFQELVTTVKRAEEFLVVVHGGLAVLMNVDKFSRFLPGTAAPQTEAESAENLKKIAAAAEDLSKRIQEMQARLEQIRSEQDVRKNAAVLYKDAERIDSRLSPIADRLRIARNTMDGVQTALKKSRDTLGYLRMEVPLALTLLFAWIALGQASLTIHGWKLLTHRRSPPDLPAT